MAKKIKQVPVSAEITERQHQLLELMLAKAGTSADLIITGALKRWIVKNTDLLTPKELKSFEDILPNEEPKPKKRTPKTLTPKKKS